MDELTVEIEIHDNLYVEFTGDPVTVDESFGHAFGIEKKIGMTVDNIKWDKKSYTNEENSLINGWLLQEHNLYKVIDLLIQKHEES
jgi:hypothetical protein